MRRVRFADPPLHLNAGDGILFRCSYKNSTAARLGWGVTNGETCMPFAMRLPTGNAAPGPADDQRRDV